MELSHQPIRYISFKPSLIAQTMPRRSNSYELGSDNSIRHLENKLKDTLSVVQGKAIRPAPVESWTSDYRGDLDLKINRDGIWFHEGRQIVRESLVRLFASILRKDEDGRHYLVTPVEKYGITVEDAPFLGVELEVHGEFRSQEIVFFTNVGEQISVGQDHFLRFSHSPADGSFRAYVHVRGRLEALVSRSLTYDLVDLAVEGIFEDKPVLGVWSGSVFFPMSTPDFEPIESQDENLRS